MMSLFPHGRMERRRNSVPTRRPQCRFRRRKTSTKTQKASLGKKILSSTCPKDSRFLCARTASLECGVCTTDLTGTVWKIADSSTTSRYARRTVTAIRAGNQGTSVEIAPSTRSPRKPRGVPQLGFLRRGDLFGPLPMHPPRLKNYRNFAHYRRPRRYKAVKGKLQLAGIKPSFAETWPTENGISRVTSSRFSLDQVDPLRNTGSLSG